eukprot:gene9968-2287_t
MNKEKEEMWTTVGKIKKQGKKQYQYFSQNKITEKTEVKPKIKKQEKKEKIDPNLLDKWKKEQIELRKQLITKNDFKFKKLENLKLIGGVDISFSKKEKDCAVASLVVLTYPELKVVYELYQKVTMKLPYKAGFLAFREVDFLLDLIETTKQKSPEYLPQLIMVDGSGIHHPRGFGLASHLGVLSDIPTIGIAKTLLVIDGITNEKVDQMKHELKGEFEYLKGDSGIIHGAIFKLGGNKNVVHVSIGHKISLETALEITQKTSIYKIPEPVRKADLLSRKYISDLEK